MTEQQMQALRGAFVNLKSGANSWRRQAKQLRDEADEADKQARRMEAMADAASIAFVQMGGSAEDAQNWWSWCYEGPKE